MHRISLVASLFCLTVTACDPGGPGPGEQDGGAIAGDETDRSSDSGAASGAADASDPIVRHDATTARRTDGSLVGSDAGRPHRSPAGRLVHWQINIGWKPAQMGQKMFFKQVASKKHLPDLVAVQDAWTVTMCGWGDKNRALSQRQPVACSNEKSPAKKSFVGMLDRLGKGKHYHIRYVGNGVKGVIWDSERLGSAPLKTWSWNANASKRLRKACCGGGKCTASGLTEDLAVAVILRDSRNTADRADDRFVGVASVHTGDFGGRCIGAIIERADALFDSWETRAHEVVRRFISGDLNRPVDTSRAHSAATRRRERYPGCWWRRIAKQAFCSPSRISYFDTVHLKHFDGATNNRASICARWTYPMRSAGHKRCNSGGAYMRIDMVFVGNSDGTLHRSKIAASEVDRGWFDTDRDGAFDRWVENYSDHRGIYTVVDY